MQDVITVTECLRVMETGAPFEVEWVTYDRTRKRGGEIKTYTCQLLQRPEGSDLVAGRAPTALEAVQHDLAWAKKNPNHKDHFTRNLVILQDGQPTNMIRKVHPPLFNYFNGKIVVP